MCATTGRSPGGRRRQQCTSTRPTAQAHTLRPIDALFAIEREIEINGQSPDERKRVRQENGRPMAESLASWLREQYARSVAQQSGRQGDRLQPHLPSALRAALPLAARTFAGFDEGGRRPAASYTLIETAALKDVDPLAWLADVQVRPQDHPAKELMGCSPGTGRSRPAKSCRLINNSLRGLHRTLTCAIGDLVEKCELTSAMRNCRCVERIGWRKRAKSPRSSEQQLLRFAAGLFLQQ